MLAQISRQLAELLCQYTNRHAEVEYVRYGLEIIIGGFLKIVVLFLLSTMFGVTAIVLAAFLTFVIFRTITGGHHYSTYGRCLFSSLVLMFGISLLTNRLVVYETKIIFLLLISIFYVVYLTYRYAPSNHFYKTMTSYQIKRLRQTAFLMIIFWSILILYFLKTGDYLELVCASILSLLAQFSSLHPITYKVVDKIEFYLDRGFIRL